MANGGRHAAYRTRRCLAGKTDVARFLRAVPKRTVFGPPDPASSAVPVAKRRQPADIEVTFPLSGMQPPMSVTLSLRQFPLHVPFGRSGFRGDPACTVPSLGRPASDESEPFPFLAAGRPATRESTLILRIVICTVAAILSFWQLLFTPHVPSEKTREAPGRGMIH